jgi:hypothetical protein
MKTALCVLVSLAACLPVFAEPKFTIVTNDALALAEGSNKYTVGMDAAEFEKRFGPPEKRLGKVGEPQTLFYTNDGIHVSTNEKGKVSNITVYVAAHHEPPFPDMKAASGATDRKIGAGASLRDIVKAYGKPDREDASDAIDSHPAEKFYEYKTKTGRFRFTFVDGSLRSIAIYR